MNDMRIAAFHCGNVCTKLGAAAAEADATAAVAQR